MSTSAAVSLPGLILSVVLGALLVPGSAQANVGPPSWGGQIVAEPTGLKDVAITREALTIDLRPLADSGPVRVEAIYQLDNRGPERKLDLVFASGSERVSAFQVWLGERSVAWTPGQQDDLPPTWQPPKQTPGIHDAKGIDYLDDKRKITPLSFSVVVPAGSQTLKVRYEAEAARHQYGRPMVYWQFAYVLAPAREWAGFGGLDVAIQLPPGWQVACVPEVQRDGDVLRGHFSDLPADAIALTVQAPVGPAYQPLVQGSRLLFGLAGIGGAVLCWWGGRSRGRLQQRAWPRAILLGIVWGLVVFGAGVFAVQGPSLAIPPLQENTYGYGGLFAMLGVLFLSVLAVPFGFGLCLIAAVIGSSTAPASVPVEHARQGATPTL